MKAVQDDQPAVVLDQMNRMVQARRHDPPHPTIYATALASVQIEPASAVFVGDTYGADYAGPVAAGMTAFLIDPERRHDIPAARRLDSIADLPERLSTGP